jgi:NAD(P)-dependent dehydrogenase (short-subunit alcohol dehydrogenase family)
MVNLQDRVAVIAGGTGALGGAIALAMLEAGAKVVVTYRRREEFDKLVAEARDASARLSGETVDVTDAEATAQLAARLGPVDILVNAVGGYAGGKTLWETDPKTYVSQVALNLQAGFALTRAFLPGMEKQNRGWVVNVASRAALVASPGAAVYAASKAGALALFRSLAAEVLPYRIHVNSVVPSIFDTPANRAAMPTADFASWPKPAEIAKVVLFLCSEEGSIVHGAEVPVYGRT